MKSLTDIEPVQRTMAKTLFRKPVFSNKTYIGLYKTVIESIHWIIVYISAGLRHRSINLVQIPVSYRFHHWKK